MASRPRPHVLDQTGPRLVTGAAGGFLAGVVLATLTAWFAASMGSSPLAPFRAIATIVQGGPPAATDLRVGMAAHAVLSAAFGLAFVVLTAMVGNDGTLMASGLLYGGLIYVVDVQILARFVGQFEPPMTNQPFLLATHLVFGGVLALFLLRPQRRPGPDGSAARRDVRRPARVS